MAKWKRARGHGKAPKGWDAHVNGGGKETGGPRNQTKAGNEECLQQKPPVRTGGDNITPLRRADGYRILYSPSRIGGTNATSQLDYWNIGEAVREHIKDRKAWGARLLKGD